MKLFSQLVIDPPWPKRKGGLRRVRPNQGRELDYTTMSVADIFQLLDEQIFPQADSQHNVWLWTIDGFLVEAQKQMELRGYRLHARMIWDKENGTAPAFTVRFTHEYLLWFYRNGLCPVAKDMRGKFTTVIRQRSTQHSRKPNEAYRLIGELYPEQPKIDVFSREFRSGWSQWGNECGKFNSEFPSEQSTDTAPSGVE